MTIERIAFLGMLSNSAHVELFEHVCDLYDHLNPIRSDMLKVHQTKEDLLDDLDDLAARENMTYTSISIRSIIDYKIMYNQMFDHWLPARYSHMNDWPEATYSTVYVMPGHAAPGPEDYPGLRFIKLHGDIYDQLAQITDHIGE